METIAILGSTGSIGRQTLDIVRGQPKHFRVTALAAGNNNLEILAEQIIEFQPNLVSVANTKAALTLKEILLANNSQKICDNTKIVCGDEGLIEVACHNEANKIVTAVVGFKGVSPTIEAIKAGKNIALANKETLVAAGSIIMPLAKQNNVQIIPVDSEHSAICQSLSGYNNKDIHQIWLTASGGPFRTWTKEAIERATADDALKHPNWSMGAKITIDSATLMNKGLEIIEACWLFDVNSNQIRVIIHPQSILHSAVEFVDRSVIGQFGMPDMHLPIQYALHYPERLASKEILPLDLVKLKNLTFEEPDLNRFPCLQLAIGVAKRPDTMPCVLNAVNEIVVDAFLKKRISFYDIASIIEKVLDLHQSIAKPSLADILEADRWARQTANEMLGALAK